MLVWGYRTKIFVLTMATFLCGRCGNPAAHAIRKSVTKFTLFFIPLFPIHIKHTAQCTFCGIENRIGKEDAVRLQEQEAQAQQQAAAQPYPQQQYPQHPSQPYQQAPQPPQGH